MEKRRALFSDAADVVKAVLIKWFHQEVVAVPLSFLQRSQSTFIFLGVDTTNQSEEIWVFNTPDVLQKIQIE